MKPRQKRGLALMLLGLALVLGAGLMHWSEQKQDQIAGQNAQLLLRKIKHDRIEFVGIVPPEPPSEEAEAGEQPVQSYLGYDLVGTVLVPELGLELPVLADWSEELLNVAPCRYSGSVAGGDMILMGHNYKSLFYPLLKATEGMTVMFTDVNGRTTVYRVAELDTIRGSEEELLASAYPLTLFTCTPGGQNRFVLRCEGQ